MLGLPFLLQSRSCPVWEFRGSLYFRCDGSASVYCECYMSSLPLILLPQENEREREKKEKKGKTSLV